MKVSCDTESNPSLCEGIIMYINAYCRIRLCLICNVLNYLLCQSVQTKAIQSLDVQLEISTKVILCLTGPIVGFYEPLP
jgi:hypothetical protein